MTLSARRQLGPYKITAPLGAGGIWEVYRARDTRRKRDVAVKVVLEHLAEDSTALGRFEREAKAVGARYPVSAGGGTNPLWRGNEIFYRRGDELMVVKTTTEPGFSTEAPVSLFQGLSNTVIPVRMFDVDHSGQRIIATLPDTQSQRPYREIRVVTGWLEQVRRRLSRDE